MTEGDYVLALALGVLVACVVIMGAFLSRYTRLVRESDNSTRLAKDVWETMNARFSVVDTRLVDLMVRTDVLSSKLISTTVSREAPSAGVALSTEDFHGKSSGVAVDRLAGPAVGQVPAGRTDTELRVLELLSQGPRSSAQIKEALGRSREHTARLMKVLFDRGLVVRNDRNKPYVYEITEAGKSYVVR